MADNMQNQELEIEKSSDDGDIISIIPMMGQNKDILQENGFIFLNGEINLNIIDNIIKQMWSYELDKDFKDTIKLVINSHGGSAPAGWALVDTIRSLSTHVITISMGMIASMGTVIAIAGDHRIISENCYIMIHHFSCLTGGNFKDLMASNQFFNQEHERSIQHYLKYSKFNTVRDIEKYILKDQDNNLTPEDMKKFGMCDEIWEAKLRKKR